MIWFDLSGKLSSPLQLICSQLKHNKQRHLNNWITTKTRRPMISSLLGHTKGGKADDEHSGGSLFKMFEIHSISFVVLQSFVLAVIVSDVGLVANSLSSSRRKSFRPWRDRWDGHVARLAQQQAQQHSQNIYVNKSMKIYRLVFCFFHSIGIYCWWKWLQIVIKIQ